MMTGEEFVNAASSSTDTNGNANASSHHVLNIGNLVEMVSRIHLSGCIFMTKTRMMVPSMHAGHCQLSVRMSPIWYNKVSSVMQLLTKRCSLDLFFEIMSFRSLPNMIQIQLYSFLEFPSLVSQHL